jgi:hypothetical protein
LRIRPYRELLMADRCSAQEDGIADRRRSSCRNGRWLLREGGQRQEQQKRPSKMEPAHLTKSYQLGALSTKHCG